MAHWEDFPFSKMKWVFLLVALLPALVLTKNQIPNPPPRNPLRSRADIVPSQTKLSTAIPAPNSCFPLPSVHLESAPYRTPIQIPTPQSPLPPFPQKERSTKMSAIVLFASVCVRTAQLQLQELAIRMLAAVAAAATIIVIAAIAIAYLF